MIKVDQYTCGQHVFFNLHNGKNENDLKIMLKSYKLSKLAGRIVFFNTYDDAAGKIWPQLCLELTDAEEIYDYDYDDNLQYSAIFCIINPYDKCNKLSKNKFYYCIFNTNLDFPLLFFKYSY